MIARRGSARPSSRARLVDEDQPLVRFGARDYDPETGTWTIKDQVGFAGGGTNLYEYAGSDPVNSADPSGFCPCQQRAKGQQTSLDDVDPELKRRAENFIRRAHDAHIDLQLAEGPDATYRTAKQQNRLYWKGRSDAELKIFILSGERFKHNKEADRPSWK